MVRVFRKNKLVKPGLRTERETISEGITDRTKRQNDSRPT
jgi:hypothetical protein